MKPTLKSLNNPASTESKQQLILTTGEPAGIGPDLCIQLAAYLAEQPVVLCGDIEMLSARAKAHGKAIQFYHHTDNPPTHTATLALAVHHTPCAAPVSASKLDVQNAQYVLDTLTIAAQHTQNGYYAGIVTAPIHKGVICETGIAFSGHTEFFAQATRTELPVMVLASDNLKVGLVTTHLPLKDVPDAITAERLSAVLNVIDCDMRRYFTAGRLPNIGVCGLNPHAGEGGHMGDEEITVINLTLDKLREQGMQVSVALPADTVFVPRHASRYDIIVAMYHDQGLPVIKAQGFGDCVNITFGLPIVRTSVDHGTALDLAGTDQADVSSLQCAIDLAQRMMMAQ